MTAALTPPTTADFRAAAGEVRTWRQPVLLTHERPDGDALGSILAMRAILQAQGITATAVVYEPIPDRYTCLPGVETLHVLGQSRARKEADPSQSRPDPDVHRDRDERPGNERGRPDKPRSDADAPTATDPILTQADGVLVMDTCAFSQLTPVAAFLRETRAPIIALDHHRTRDLPAGRYLIDVEAAAAALLVYDWARAAGWELPSEAQSLLFVGIATDTGWFRHSNTSAAALRAAAELVEGGVDLDRWHQALYLSDPVRALRARASALAGMELHQGERVALMMVTRAALAAAGALPADLEEAVNIPMSAAAVEVSIVLVEQENGGTKVSLRSKGGVDVAKLAAQFGGGGHSRAAGARIAKPLAAAREAILAALAAKQ